MNAKSILGLAVLALPMISMAQAGSNSLASEQAGPKTRAEVRADLAMWQRAGLSTAYNSEGFDPSAPDVQRRLAEYTRLRNGPEYQAELQRIQGGEPQRAISGTAASNVN